MPILRERNFKAAAKLKMGKSRITCYRCMSLSFKFNVFQLIPTVCNVCYIQSLLLKSATIISILNKIVGLMKEEDVIDMALMMLQERETLGLLVNEMTRHPMLEVIVEDLSLRGMCCFIAG